MKILVLGGDGYCGWATSLYLSSRGHQVAIVENFVRRKMDMDLGIKSLTPISSFLQRHRAWKSATGIKLKLYQGDVTYYNFLSLAINEFEPDAVVHFAEQRSAPYSMMSRENAVYTQSNNVIGTLNLLYALKEHAPDC